MEDPTAYRPQSKQKKKQQKHLGIFNIKKYFIAYTGSTIKILDVFYLAQYTKYQNLNLNL